MELLDEQGRIKALSEHTGGRTAMRYFLTEYFEYEFDEINEESPEVGIPRVITPLMRKRLRDCGETDEEIDNMTPPEAAALVQYFDGYEGSVS